MRGIKESKELAYCEEELQKAGPRIFRTRAHTVLLTLTIDQLSSVLILKYQ